MKQSHSSLHLYTCILSGCWNTSMHQVFYFSPPKNHLLSVWHGVKAKCTWQCESTNLVPQWLHLSSTHLAHNHVTMATARIQPIRILVSVYTFLTHPTTCLGTWGQKQIVNINGSAFTLHECGVCIDAASRCGFVWSSVCSLFASSCPEAGSVLCQVALKHTNHCCAVWVTLHIRNLSIYTCV